MRPAIAFGLVLILNAMAGVRAIAQTATANVAPAAPGTVVVNPTTTRGNLWTFFGFPDNTPGRVWARVRRSSLGSLVANATKPIGLFTGGTIGRPPGSSPSNSMPGGSAGAAPAAGSGGTAVAETAGAPAASDPAAGPKAIQSASASIKAYQAEAKATVAAIEELSSLDCNYWPEAKKAFITGLRVNRLECVRLASAKALGRGCCCNKETIEALRITVSASTEDGNPAESSPRVRAAAFSALQHCLNRPDSIAPGPSDAPPDLSPIEAPSPANYLAAQSADNHRARGDYYDVALSTRSDRQVIADSWRTLALLSMRAEASGAYPAHAAANRMPQASPGEIARASIP
jgi:hypothetical protein